MWDRYWGDAQKWALRATTADTEGEPPGDDRWTYLQLEFMSHLHTIAILLRLGPDAYIITPKRLR